MSQSHDVDLPLGHRTEEVFRELLESAPDAMVVVDRDGRIALVNSQTERLFGHPRSDLLGQPVELLIPERAHERHREHRAHYLSDGSPRAMGEGLQLSGRRKDGGEFPVEISLSPLHTRGGLLVSAAIRDISERARAEADAYHFAAVVESSSDAIIGKTLDGVVVSWNAAAERLYGYTAEEMIGKSISTLVPPDRDDELARLLRRVRAGELIDNVETRQAHKDGTQVEVSLTISPIRDKLNRIVGASTIARDVSAVVRYREQLRYLADHDALTGARNRRRFERDLVEEVGRARRYGEHSALLIIDVDQFKSINDRFGHKAGDLALQAVAAGLRQRLRETDVIARLGGDEFGVLLPYAHADQAVKVAADLRRAIAERPLRLEDAPELALSISVGVVNIDGTCSSDELLSHADRAMYADKRRDHLVTLRLPEQATGDSGLPDPERVV